MPSRDGLTMARSPSGKAAGRASRPRLRVLGTGAMEPMWSQLAELTMPVALVTGTLDQSYGEIASQMRERTGGPAEHVRLEGGHSLPLEQPAALGGFIAAFAAQHG